MWDRNYGVVYGTGHILSMKTGSGIEVTHRVVKLRKIILTIILSSKDIKGNKQTTLNLK